MKIRRKTNECPNCNALLDSVYNYCPLCGQENTNNYVSFNMLVGDFFNTFFALDSKFAKTIVPFLFKPGSLTNLYVSGKRVSFAHPLRFYLIISLFFFFIFTLAGKKSVEEDDKNGIITISYNLNSITGLDSASSAILKATLDEETLEQIEEDLKGHKIKHLREALQKNVSQEEKEALRSALDSATAARLFRFQAHGPEQRDTNAKDRPIVISPVRIESDSNALKLSKGEEEKEVNTSDKEQDEKFFDVFDRINWVVIEELKDDRKITDDQVYDSLHIENVTELQERVIRQVIRVNRADQQLFIEYILKNLPLMMLILIPFFALILKLLYVRRKQLYIKHLIHALHLHTFAYFFYGLSLIIMVYVIAGEDHAAGFGMLSFIAVSTYAYLSFLKVYGQHWFKTLIKFNVTGALYLTCIILFFVAELAISFLLY